MSLREAYWNTMDGNWHGLCVNGQCFVCPRKDEHDAPKDCEIGPLFTVNLILGKEYDRDEVKKLERELEDKAQGDNRFHTYIFKRPDDLE